jgi:hypothetical protein
MPQSGRLAQIASLRSGAIPPRNWPPQAPNPCPTGVAAVLGHSCKRPFTDVLLNCRRVLVPRARRLFRFGPEFPDQDRPPSRAIPGTITLVQLGTELTRLGLAPVRGGNQWAPSSVKALLDRARTAGLLAPTWRQPLRAPGARHPLPPRRPRRYRDRVGLTTPART